MIGVNTVSLHNSAYLHEPSSVDSQGTDGSTYLFNISNRVYYTDAIPRAGGRQAGYGDHSTDIPRAGSGSQWIRSASTGRQASRKDAPWGATPCLVSI